MRNPCIILFSGLPGAGKSTLINALVDLYNSSTPTFEIFVIQRDNVFHELKNTLNTEHSILQDENFTREVWHMAGAEMRFQVQSILDKIEAPLILLEDNFELDSMRKPYFRIAGTSHAAYGHVHLNVSCHIAQARNHSRDIETIVPLRSITNIYTRMSTCSGFPTWETERIHVMDATLSLSNLVESTVNFIEQIQSSVVEDLNECATRGVVVREQSRTQTSHNAKHQAELYIRKLIGAIVRNLTDIRQNDKPTFQTLINILSILKKATCARFDENENFEAWRQAINAEPSDSLLCKWKDYIERSCNMSLLQQVLKFDEAQASICTLLRERAVPHL